MVSLDGAGGLCHLLSQSTIEGRVKMFIPAGLPPHYASGAAGPPSCPVEHCLASAILGQIGFAVGELVIFETYDFPLRKALQMFLSKNDRL